jgi:hypothetical protein
MADILEKFRATEAQYNELKERHSRGELNAREVKAELKRLMLQDEDGKYWMLGGKSGKWYVHDGSQWQEGDPYEQFKPFELEQEQIFPDIPGSADEQEPVISTSGEYVISMESSETASESAVSVEEEAAGSEEQPFTALESEKESDDAYKDMEIESHSYGVSYSEQDSGSHEHEEAEAAEVEAQVVDTGEYYELHREEPMKSESTDEMYKEEEIGVEIELEKTGEDVLEEEKVGEEEIGEEAVPAEDTGMDMDAGAAAVEAGAVPAVIDTGEKEEVQEKEYINCKICESRIPPYAVYCTFCGANQKEVDKKSIVKPLKKGMESELLVKYIKLTSLLFFLGGLGLIAGVILGACFGIFSSFMSGSAEQLPMMLRETRGGVAGGLIFAAIGGIGGFILSAFLALALCGIYNLISHIFGGIRFKVKQ